MKNNILLVEDDASLAASLEQVLSLAGYNVTVAADGEAGLELARAGCFAAAVTDFRLPRLSGLELVKQIYAVNPDAHHSYDSTRLCGTGNRSDKMGRV